MPYSITTEDGVTLNDIPDNVLRNDPEVLRKIQRLRFKRKFPNTVSKSPSDAGVLGNLTKGFGAGFVGTGEIAGLGIATLLEEQDELAARTKIQDIAKSFKPEGGDPDSISYGLGQALGSIAGFGAAAGTTAGIAGLAGAAAPVVAGIGTGTAAGLGVTTMAGEASERARAADATEEQRNIAIRTAAPFGVLEALPLTRLFKSVDVPVINKLIEKFGPDNVETIGQKVQNSFITGGLEGAQEATTEIIQNLTEQQYNDLAETFGGTGEAFGFGAAAGAILDLFLGGKKRRAIEEDDDAAPELDIDEESGQINLFPGLQAPKQTDKKAKEAPEFKLEPPPKDDEQAAEIAAKKTDIDKVTAEEVGITEEQLSFDLGEELLNKKQSTLVNPEELKQAKEHFSNQKRNIQGIADQDIITSYREETGTTGEGFSGVPTTAQEQEQLSFDLGKEGLIASETAEKTSDGLITYKTLKSDIDKDVEAIATQKRKVKDLEDNFKSAITTGEIEASAIATSPAGEARKEIGKEKDKLKELKSNPILKEKDKIDSLIAAEGVTLNKEGNEDKPKKGKETKKQTDERIQRNIARNYLKRFARPIDAYYSLGYEIGAEVPKYRAQKDASPEEVKKFKGTGGLNAEETYKWLRTNLGTDSDAIKTTDKYIQDSLKLSIDNEIGSAGRVSVLEPFTGKEKSDLQQKATEGQILADYQQALDARFGEGAIKVKATKTDKVTQTGPVKDKVTTPKVTTPKVTTTKAATKKRVTLSKEKAEALASFYDASLKEYDAEIARLKVEGKANTKEYKNIVSEKEVLEEAILKLYASDSLKMKGLSTVGKASLESTLNKDAVQSIEVDGLKQTLLNMLDSIKDKRMKRIVQALADNVGGTNITTITGAEFKKLGFTVYDKPARGMFVPRGNTIYLNSDFPITNHTILHEVVHAVTLNTIRGNPSSPLTKQITKLFNDVKGELDTAYGATNVEEFVAEAFSNPEFATKLGNINTKGKNIPAIVRFYRAVTNYIRTLFGMDTKPLGSALDSADASIMAMVSPSPDFYDTDPVALIEPAKKILEAIKVTRRKLGLGGPFSKQAREDHATRSAEFLPDVSDGVKSFFLRLKGTQSLGDTAKAVGFDDIGLRLHEELENQRGAQNKADENTRGVLDRLAKWGTKNPKLERALADIIYDSEFGATLYQVNPYGRRTEYLGKYDSDGNDLGKVFDAQQKKLKEFTAAEQASIKNEYIALRDFYKAEYNKLKDLLFSRIDDGLGKDSEAAKTLKKTVFEKLFDNKTLDVYFPLSRRGHYKLSYNVVGPSVKKSDAYVIRMFESKEARDRAAEKARKDSNFVNITSIDGSLDIKEFVKAPPNSFVKDTLDTLEGKGVSAEIRSEIMNLFIDTLPETSFARSLQKRAGFEGFIEDPLFALQSKGFDLARQVERIRYAKRIQDIEKEIQERAKKLVKNEERVRVAKGVPLNRASVAAVAREMLSRAKFGREGAEQKNIEQYVRGVNQIAFIYTIGFNASSAIVNLSQVPLVVIPYLTPRFGASNTNRNVFKAASIVRRSGLKIQEMFDVDGSGNYTIKKDIKQPLRKQLENLEPLVKLAAERGQLNNTFLADALGLDDSGKLSKGGTGIRALDKIASLSAVMFNAGERFNRQVVLITSYNSLLEEAVGGTVKGKLKRQPTAEEKIKAAQEALYITQKTNGGAVLETGAGAAQQGVGRIALMYKNYGLQMYQTMFDSLFTALDSNFSGKERRIALLQLVGMLGSSVLFAGIRGIPIYGAMALAYNATHDDEEEDFDTVVRKYIGEGFFKGPLVELTGVDFSNRVRLSGLLLQENKYNYDASFEETIFFHIGGPAFSTAKRALLAAQDFNRGEIERGIESSLPAGITNAIRNSGIPSLYTGRYAREGIVTRRGDIIKDDLTFGELAGGFIGFPSKDYTFKMEQNNIEKRIDVAVNKRVTNVMRKYNVGVVTGNEKQAQEAMDEMVRIEKRHPNIAFTGRKLKKSADSFRNTTQKIHNGVYISPLMRRAMEELRLEYKMGFGFD